MTKELREFVISRGDQNIAEFLEFLIGGFYKEYENWDKPGPSHGYFTFFRRARFRSLRLVAHAYFHMGYDLPRTIADSLSALPELDILANGRNDARRTFLQLNDIFPKVFAEESRSYSSNGIFGLVGKIVPRPLTIIPAYWIIQMRTVAWVNAEMLADEPDVKKKRQLESEILNCVTKAGEDLKRKRWNPALWLTVLPAPSASLIAWYLQQSDIETVSPWTGVAFVAFLFVSLYLVFVYLGLKWIARDLGRHITQNLEELLPPEYRDLLGDIRREGGAEIFG